MSSSVTLDGPGAATQSMNQVSSQVIDVRARVVGGLAAVLLAVPPASAVVS